LVVAHEPIAAQRRSLARRQQIQELTALGQPKFDTTTPFSAAAVHQSDGGSTTYTIPTVVFAEPV
jgi:hypothetical protein